MPDTTNMITFHTYSSYLVSSYFCYQYFRGVCVTFSVC